MISKIIIWKTLISIIVIIAFSFACGKSGKDYYELGKKSFDNKKLYEAKELLTKAILYDSTNAEYYNLRGQVFYESFRYSEGIADFTKVIDLEPYNKNAYFYRGLCNYFGYQGNRNNTVSDLTKAIDLVPNDMTSYFYRGKALFELKNYNDAISDFGKIIEINPIDTIAYYHRGRCFLELKQYINALNDFNKILELNSNNEDAYYYRGITFYFMKEYNKAIVDLSKTIELNSYYLDAYLYRGKCYSEGFNDNLKAYFDFTNEIEKGYEKVICSANEDNSEDAYFEIECYEAFFERGIVNLKLKEYNNAISDFENSTSEHAHYYCGIAYFKIGNLERACEEWNNAYSYNQFEAKNYLDKYCK